jgi:hypothetical protein
MSDQLAVGSTHEGYAEVEGNEDGYVRLKCQCGQVVKKRRDAFVPGLHVVICLACGNNSTEVTMLDGEHRSVSAEDHRSTGL